MLYSQSDFDSKKKSGLREKKNMPYENIMQRLLNSIRKSFDVPNLISEIKISFTRHN